MYSYRAFNLNIHSQLILPELLEAHDDNHDVKIVYNKLIDFDSYLNSEDEWFFFLNNDLYFLVEGVAKFKVSNGCLIEVDPYISADEDNLRLFILGSGFGALLHQRNLTPIHASAVEIDGEVVMFSADSGIGKSTLCQGFQNKGYKLVADDVCVLYPNKGAVFVCPSYPQVKLWEDSMGFFNFDINITERVRKGEDKFKVKSSFVGQPLKLKAIFFLGVEDVEKVILKEVRSIEKIIKIKENIFRPFFMNSERGIEEKFHTLAKLSNGVPFYHLIRPKGFYTNIMIDEVLKIVRL